MVATAADSGNVGVGDSGLGSTGGTVTTEGGPGPVLVDVLGLCPYSDEFSAEMVAGSLGLPETAVYIREPGERLEYLAALMDGAGYTVITGPLGREFWELVSVEVQVRVEPDGYQHTDRCETIEWALREAGVPSNDVAGLVKKPPKTAKHKYMARWLAAQDIEAGLRATTYTVPSLVHEAVSFEVKDVAWAEAVLTDETGKYWAVDWEWNRVTQEPVGMAMSDEHDNFYVPLVGKDYRAPEGHAERLQRAFAKWAMYGWGVMHGGQADLATVYPGDPEELCGRWKIDDTMVMAYLIGEPVLKLKPLTAKYLGHSPIENEYEWAEQPVRFTARYAAAGDTRNTYDLYQVLKAKLAEQGKQVEVYEGIERPLIPRVASMERGGVPIDIPGTIRQHWEAVVYEEGIRKAVLIAYGYDLRDDECARKFIVSNGFPDPGTLDQRVISLNPHWCIDLVLLYRQTRTRRRNFLGASLKKWALAGMPAVFRLHPHFNQCGSMDDENKRAPRSGRFSSSGPNIQQQPRSIRSIFVAPPGCLWWSFDYSGLELRIAAAVSGDAEMWAGLTEECPDGELCKHFPKHGDLHSRFQFKIYEQTGRMLERPHVKTGNFEQLYFGGDEQMVKILAKQRAFIDRAVAKVISDGHKRAFGRYHEWAGEIRVESRARGYAETVEGRRRVIPELYSDDDERRGYGERACVNHAIQGTGADIVKTAMNELTPVLRKYGAHMALQVHDELDGWIPATADVAEFEREVRAVMQRTLLGMPLLVEGGTANGTAKTWEEAH